MNWIRHGHVGVFTDDLARSAAFYRDVLGGKAMEPLVLSEELTIQHVLFDGVDIELVLQKDAIEACDGRVNHLCFETDDAREVYQTIRQAGYTIDKELVENPDVSYFFFRGPDQERIEIMQRNSESV